MSSNSVAISNIPIVIAACNRAHTLQRLLASLAKAHYAEPVKLIISIDGGGPESVKTVARDFEWAFGPKEIIEHSENLGLRRHILSCGDISRQYDGIILLEDDLYVSPWYFKYTIDALNYYQDTQQICGISLYSYQYNETALLPFKPLNDGSDAYFMQLPCSWGQAWLKDHWACFRAWYANNSSSSLQDDPALPSNVAFWPDTSWKKYFLKYMVENNKFFVYPHISYTTNFGDKGQHHQGTNVFQVPLFCGSMGSHSFKYFDDCFIKYDVFCELLPECLDKLSEVSLPFGLSVDLYGSKRKENIAGEYVITSKKCKSYIASFGRRMVPQELNIIKQIEGSDIYLAKKDQLEDFGDINKYIYNRAIDVKEQKYFFSTDDVHYSRLKEAESLLAQFEANTELIANSSEMLRRMQCLEDALSGSELRIKSLSSSRSWRITKPLRWLGDLVRKL